ncbi:MAG: efflux RND transporter periplasmic adaptor subunit [Planctomycetes bacterium]|nr:efflux RND transporter periplasmic adaptor subunit [Planctomycetota bacterium]
MGFTAPYREVTLSGPGGALLVELLVEEGAVVEAGQVIGKLETDALEAELAVAVARGKAEGAIQAYRADLESKRKRFEALLDLSRTGAAGADEVERARTEHAVAESRLHAALEEKEIHRLEGARIEIEIRDRTLRSPFRGVVRRVHRRVGERLPAVDPAVVEIVEMERLRAEFFIPLGNLPAFAVGSPVRIAFENPEAEAEGQVVFRDPVADRASGTVRIAVTVANEDGKLLAGVRCRLLRP